MNIHNQLPRNTYLIATTTTTHAAPQSGKIFAITCTTGGTVKVKGAGIFEYVDIDGANADTVVKYINPDTGKAFPNVVDGSSGDLANGKAAGFYERSVETDLVMVAGQTVYGRFDSAISDGSFKGFFYAG